MTGAFDPYQRWLEIPPDQQPPDPYRLLGLVPFEPDAEVILRAANRQIAHVGTFQAGEHADDCRRLLSEIASARDSLLDAARREAVDRRLRARLAAQPAVPTSQPAVPTSQPAVRADEPAVLLTRPVSGVQANRQRTARGRRRAGLEVLKIVAGGAAGLALGLLLPWLGVHRHLQQSLLPRRSDSPAASRPEPSTSAPAGPLRERPEVREADPFQVLTAAELARFARTPTPSTPEWLATADWANYGFRGAPAYTTGELVGTLDAATAAAPLAERIFDADAALTPEEKKQLARQLHAPFCELAEVITFSDFGQPEVQSRLAPLERLLRQIADTPQKWNALGFVGSERWQAAEPPPAGILLAGTVEAIRGEPRLYRTEVRLAGGVETRVAVYSWRDPVLFCKLGDRVVVLGRTVEDPGQNLAGYAGDERRVVWGGYLVTL